MSKFSKIRHSIKRDAIIKGRHIGYVGHAKEIINIDGDILFQDGNHFYGIIQGHYLNTLEDKEDFFFLRKKIAQKGWL